MKGKVKYFVLVLLSIFMYSCTNTSEDVYVEKEYEIKGNVSTKLEGAYPSAFSSPLKSNYMRNALPSTWNGFEYNLTATKIDGSKTVTSKSDSEGFFLIKLTAGSWIVTAEGTHNGGAVFRGQSEVITISESHTYDNGISINTKPVSVPSIDEDGNPYYGTANLELCFENNQFKYSKVTAEWKQNGENHVINYDFTGKSVDATINFDMIDGETNAEGIPAGVYSVTFTAYRSRQNNAGENRDYPSYRCRQSVNIFGGMLTNTWYQDGKAEYFYNETKTSVALTGSEAVLYVADILTKSFERSVFYVKAGESESNNGTYFDPYNTIQKAVDHIVFLNDEQSIYKIFVDGDFDAESTMFTNDALIEINTDAPLSLEIIGQNALGNKIDAKRSAENPGQLVKIVQGNAEKNITFENIELAGGFGTSNGIAISFEETISSTANANITLKDCKITSNTTVGDGVIYVNTDKVFLNIENTDFADNTSKDGGAIYLGCPAAIKSSTFTGNAAGGAGGAINAKLKAAGELLVEDCTFTNNSAVKNGGAINLEEKVTLNIKSCTFTGNSVEGYIDLNDNFQKSYGGAVFVPQDNSVTINIQGTNEIKDNIAYTALEKASEEKSNIHLSENKKLNITGDLGESEIGVKIGVLFDTDSYVFTDKYSESNSVNPGIILTSDDDYMLSWNDNVNTIEAAFFISSGSITSSMRENITFRVDKSLLRCSDEDKTLTIEVGKFAVEEDETRTFVSFENTEDKPTNFDFELALFETDIPEEKLNKTTSSTIATVTFADDWPAGNYNLIIKAVYHGIVYSDSVWITLTE